MMSSRRPPPPSPSPAPLPLPLSTTTTTITPHPQQDSPPPPPTSQIIPILPTEFANIYNITHPFLILSLYLFSFPSIVANPVPALQYLLIPLSCLQLVYVVTCLPTITTTNTTTPTNSTTTNNTTTTSGSGESSSPFSIGGGGGGALSTPSTTSKNSSSLSKKKRKGRNVRHNGFSLSGKVVVSYAYIRIRYENYSPHTHIFFPPTSF